MGKSNHRSGGHCIGETLTQSDRAGDGNTEET